MAVMNAGRIVEQCPKTAILEDRQHPHPVVVPHE
jgi:ABC-type dipeptide/oligopeptide/nickel transport system ATPase component